MNRLLITLLAFTAVSLGISGCSATDSAIGLLTGKKITRVEAKVGKITITDDEDAVSHVRIDCNNGLQIDADWKRNPANNFGYDIYEPTVNRDENRLAVMMSARMVIAAYLRGEYE